MCFTYVIEILIVCLCSSIFWSVSFSCQWKFFLSGFNHTDDFIAMHRKRNVSILFFSERISGFLRGEWASFGDVSFSEQPTSRRHSPDVKVTAVCQSLTILLRDTTYGLRVSASFLRKAPGPAWGGGGGGGASPGGTGAIAERAGLNNGLGPEVCAMETVGYMDCWCSFGAPNPPN